jgi:hypothetical protein
MADAENITHKITQKCTLAPFGVPCTNFRTEGLVDTLYELNIKADNSLVVPIENTSFHFYLAGKYKGELPEEKTRFRHAVARFASGASDVEFSRILLEEKDKMFSLQCLDREGEIWKFVSHANIPEFVVENHFINPELENVCMKGRWVDDYPDSDEKIWVYDE